MHQRIAGIDVILIGQEDGAVSSETREFGGFKRDMRSAPWRSGTRRRAQPW
jgi:hypothetical protein